ncbi:MAG: MFS transporter [Chloroflexota bacterium]|nr:MFS transporter [Chloroflexota bacterium]
MAHFEVPPEVLEQDPSGTANVFGNRAFVSLWIAQLLSQLASNMVLAALMATVFDATGSNSAVAALILTFLVPAVAFSAVAGVYVDRVDARLIMLSSNVLRAAATIAFVFVGGHVGLILLVNLFIATVSAFFAPAELTTIPRVVERRSLMAANSVFTLTINGTFAVGFGLLGPLLLRAGGTTVVYVVVAAMFALAAAAIVPLASVPPRDSSHEVGAGRAARALVEQLREGIVFVRQNHGVAWALSYLGIAASLIGVMGVLGPGFADTVLGLASQDFFFIMGPAGLGAVIGILFLNSYGRLLPQRLLIDVALVAMGITLVGLAVVKPVTSFLSTTVPIEANLPQALSPLLSVIAVVLVIAVLAGLEYAFVAIPSQTALQEELPPAVRGRIFGILNTLLSFASFFPVVVVPIIADLLDTVSRGNGIPFVMALLGIVIAVAGVASYRHNRSTGAHRRRPSDGASAAAAPAGTEASGR